MAITYRSVKGSALTHAELDANFTDLNGRIIANAADISTADTVLLNHITSAAVARYTHGIEDHNSTDPALTPASGGRTRLLNNSLGAYTNLNYKIPGRGNIWNSGTDSFDFLNAGLVIGDTVTIRLDLTVTTASTHDGIEIELDLGAGASTYTLHLGEHTWRSSGVHNLTVVSEIYMGDANTLNNPGTLYVTPNASGTSIVYKGHYVKYSLRTPSVS